MVTVARAVAVVGRAATLALLALLSQGCAGFHLYDAGKDTVAQQVKTDYADAKVPTVLEAVDGNLRAMLAEEIKLLRETRELQLDLAFTRMADGEPVGVRLAPGSAFTRRLAELGHRDAASLRAFLQDVAGRSAVAVSMDLLAGRIENIARRRPPACDAQNRQAALDELLAGASATARPLLEIEVARYRTLCERLGQAEGHGEIGEALAEWRQARQAVESRRQRLRDAAAALKAATAAHDAAVKAVAESATPQSRARLEAAIKAMRDALDGAEKGAEVLDLEIVPEARVQALDTILVVAGGNNVGDDAVKDPAVARAATVASGLPSLAPSVEAMLRTRRGPAVAHLLIEKEHQLALRDDVQRRVQLAEQRTMLAEKRYRALLEESSEILREHDALCRFVAAAQGWTGARCDTLAVARDAADARALRCELVTDTGRQTLEGAACPLGKDWIDAFKTGVEPKRHLYDAIAARTRAVLIARARQDEADAETTHTLHQEVAQTNAYAVRAWNAILETPVSQLAGYHASGIKPAELADLIIKAVGLGAIGIGVNR